MATSRSASTRTPTTTSTRRGSRCRRRWPRRPATRRTRRRAARARWWLRSLKGCDLSQQHQWRRKRVRRPVYEVVARRRWEVPHFVPRVASVFWDGEHGRAASALVFNTARNPGPSAPDRRAKSAGNRRRQPESPCDNGSRRRGALATPSSCERRARLNGALYICKASPSRNPCQQSSAQARSWSCPCSP